MTRRQNVNKRPRHVDTTETDRRDIHNINPWRDPEVQDLGVCIDCTHLVTDNRSRWCTSATVHAEYTNRFGKAFKREGKTLPELTPINPARRICRGHRHSKGMMP